MNFISFILNVQIVKMSKYNNEGHTFNKLRS